MKLHFDKWCVGLMLTLGLHSATAAVETTINNTAVLEYTGTGGIPTSEKSNTVTTVVKRPEMYLGPKNNPRATTLGEASSDDEQHAIWSSANLETCMPHTLENAAPLADSFTITDKALQSASEGTLTSVRYLDANGNPLAQPVTVAAGGLLEFQACYTRVAGSSRIAVELTASSKSGALNITRDVLGTVLLTKIADTNEAVSPGMNITYTLRVENKSLVNLVNAEILDTLDSGLTFVSASDGGTHTAGQLAWTVNVPAGGSKEVTVTAEVKPVTQPNVALLNSFTLTNPEIPDKRTSNETKNLVLLPGIYLGPKENAEANPGGELSDSDVSTKVAVIDPADPQPVCIEHEVMNAGQAPDTITVALDSVLEGELSPDPAQKTTIIPSSLTLGVGAKGKVNVCYWPKDADIKASRIKTKLIATSAKKATANYTIDIVDAGPVRLSKSVFPPDGSTVRGSLVGVDNMRKRMSLLTYTLRGYSEVTLDQPVFTDCLDSNVKFMAFQNMTLALNGLRPEDVETKVEEGAGICNIPFTDGDGVGQVAKGNTKLTWKLKGILPAKTRVTLAYVAKINDGTKGKTSDTFLLSDKKTVAYGLPDGTIIPNNFTLTAQEADRDYRSNTVKTQVWNSVLGLNKTSSPEIVSLGTQMTFNITPSNTSKTKPVVLTKIVDCMPKGLIYVAGTSSYKGTKIRDPFIVDPATVKIVSEVGTVQSCAADVEEALVWNLDVSGVSISDRTLEIAGTPTASALLKFDAKIAIDTKEDIKNVALAEAITKQRIHVSPPLDGDLNGDGVVDGIDFYLAGDVNKDGKYTLADVQQLVLNFAVGDVNGDGVVNSQDFEILRNGDDCQDCSNRGDVNGDGVVDARDAQTATTGVNLEIKDNGVVSNATGDVNGDGKIDGKDVAALGDINKDGKVDDKDLNALQDINGDGKVDAADLKLLGDRNSDGKIDAADMLLNGDINNDGVVNQADLTILGDANKDGTITAADLILAGDSDGNGIIDDKDVIPYIGKGGIDLNNDGYINAADVKLLGDLNKDGVVNADDLKQVVNIYDVNKDGTITLSDLQGAGDLNQDGKVDNADVLANLYDRNGDGKVDATDLVLLGDTNKDGKVDNADVIGDVNGDGLVTVDDLKLAGDINGDGVVDAGDLSALGDTNKDGVVDAADVVSDINKDGKVNVTDLQLFGDINKDGVVNATDVTLLGDRNNDGKVDITDLNLAGDLNGDSVVDSKDAVIFQSNNTTDLNGDGKVNAADTSVLGDRNNDGVITLDDLLLAGDYNKDGVVDNSDTAAYVAAGGQDLNLDNFTNTKDLLLLGDANKDGKVDAADLQVLGDLNKDGKIDATDAKLVSDVNGDGKVDSADLKGDVNKDGKVDVADLNLAGDLNKDGVVDNKDVVVLQDVNKDGFINAKDGDVNGDGTVDVKDLIANSDINKDGVVDVADLNLLGDLNKDGTVDAADVLVAQDINKDGKVDAADGDLNSDGKVDAADLNLAGDLNGDGKVDATDLNLLGDLNKDGKFDSADVVLANKDLNKDGKIDGKDVVLIGDLNQDGRVDVKDALALSGDINGDGKVNQEDVRLFIKSGGKDMNGDGKIDVKDAIASAQNNQLLVVASSAANKPLKIIQTVFPNTAVMLGRAYIDINRDRKYQQGLDIPYAGARIVLSNGRSFITDAEGRYSADLLTPGLWASRIDMASVPYTPESLPEDRGQLGSRTVMVQGLTTVDFPLEPADGRALSYRQTRLEYGPVTVVKSVRPAGAAQYTISLQVTTTKDLPDFVLVEELPKGAKLVAGVLQPTAALLTAGEHNFEYTFSLNAPWSDALVDPQVRWRYP